MAVDVDNVADWTVSMTDFELFTEACSEIGSHIIYCGQFTWACQWVCSGSGCFGQLLSV